MGESMSRNRKKKAKRKGITVHIYESEYRQIQAWVDKHQNLETGGDLFGLWADENTAVVQLVLGPGKHCTRTPASFYQDVEYLERVGNLLTYKEGLCHIGEWHSHHRLGLKEPSGGDKNTVWSNMERYGIYRFCLFIATIDGSWSRRGSTPDDVSVRGFHFTTSNQHRHLTECIFAKSPEESPFRLKYNDEVNEGVESVNEERETQKAFVPVDLYKSKGEKHAYRGPALGEAVERPGYGEPEGKKQYLQHSYLRRFINLILYVCCPVWLCCKRLCNALGRCICFWMWFLNDKETEKTKPTEPAKHCWTFGDLIHLCCPICWFVSNHQ